MTAASGPICQQCGQVVPAVRFTPVATDDGAKELGLCPDCLRRAEEEGLLAAPVIPIRRGRRPRPARRRRR